MQETSLSNRAALGMREFAAAMGIATSTAWKWAKEDRVRITRVGGRTLVPMSEVHRLLGDASPVAA